MAKGKFSEDEVRYAIESDCLGSMDFFHSFLNYLIGSKHKDKRIKKKNYFIDPNEYFYFKRKDSLYFIKEMFSFLDEKEMKILTKYFIIKKGLRFNLSYLIQYTYTFLKKTANNLIKYYKIEDSLFKNCEKINELSEDSINHLNISEEKRRIYFNILKFKESILPVFCEKLNKKNAYKVVLEYIFFITQKMSIELYELINNYTIDYPIIKKIGKENVKSKLLNIYDEILGIRNDTSVFKYKFLIITHYNVLYYYGSDIDDNYVKSIEYYSKNKKFFLEKYKPLNYQNRSFIIKMKSKNGRTLLIRMLEMVLDVLNVNFRPDFFKKYMQSEHNVNIQNLEKIDRKDKINYNDLKTKSSISENIIINKIYDILSFEPNGNLSYNFWDFKKDGFCPGDKIFFVPVVVQTRKQDYLTFATDICLGIINYLYEHSFISEEKFYIFLKKINFISNRDVYVTSDTNYINRRNSLLSSIIHDAFDEIKYAYCFKVVVLIDEVESFNFSDYRRLNEIIKNTLFYGISLTFVRFNTYDGSNGLCFSAEKYLIYLSTLSKSYENNKKQKLLINDFRIKNININDIQVKDNSLPNDYISEVFIKLNKVEYDKISEIVEYYNGQTLSLYYNLIPIINKDEVREFYEDHIDVKDTIANIYNVIKTNQKSDYYNGYNIALFGNFGAGKTSVLNLLSSYLISQQDIKKLDIKSDLIINVGITDYSSKSIVEEIYYHLEQKIIDECVKQKIMNSYKYRVKKFLNNKFDLGLDLDINTKNDKMHVSLKRRIDKYIHAYDKIKTSQEIEDHAYDVKTKYKYSIIIILISITLFMLFLIAVLFSIRPILLADFLNKVLKCKADVDVLQVVAAVSASLVSLFGTYFVYKGIRNQSSNELINNKITSYHISKIIMFFKKHSLYESRTKKFFISRFFLRIYDRIVRNDKYLYKYPLNVVFILDDLDRVSNEKIKNILQGITFLKNNKDNNFTFVIPISYEKFVESSIYLNQGYTVKYDYKKDKNVDTVEYNYKNNDMDNAIALDNQYLNKIFDYKVYIPEMSNETIYNYVEFMLQGAIKKNFFKCNKQGILNKIYNTKYIYIISMYFKIMKIDNLRDISSILNESFNYYYNFKCNNDTNVLLIIMLINLCHVRSTFVEFVDELIFKKQYVQCLKSFNGDFDKPIIVLNDNMHFSGKLTNPLLKQKYDDFVFCSLKFYYEIFIDGIKLKKDIVFTILERVLDIIIRNN